MAREQKVHIIPGFTEGNGHTKKLVRALTANGFVLADNAADANIIITHSGGCFLLPDALAGKTVLIANPPWDYRGSIFKNTLCKITLDIREHRQLRAMKQLARKSVWSGLYFVSCMPRHVQMYRQMPRFAALLKQSGARHIIVVAAKGDPWTRHISIRTIEQNPWCTFLSVATMHDDLWMHPARYVAIIQSIYEP
ncbi:MAG TPA: hypothetical protein VJR27_03600 [Candidatus Saccharimonadales bacterium]|nr:hypothetical protein [Candidatus Saccharimonadales bacterium]